MSFAVHHCQPGRVWIEAFVTAPGGTGAVVDEVLEPDEEPLDGEPVLGVWAGTGSGVCTGDDEALEALPPHEADNNNSAAVDNIAAMRKQGNRENDFD